MNDVLRTELNKNSNTEIIYRTSGKKVISSNDFKNNYVNIIQV